MFILYYSFVNTSEFRDIITADHLWQCIALLGGIDVNTLSRCEQQFLTNLDMRQMLYAPTWLTFDMAIY